MAILTGTHPDLIKALERAKLLPPNTRRVIIDICYDDAVRVYYECLGDERVLKLSLPKVFSEAQFIQACDVEEVRDEAP